MKRAHLIVVVAAFVTALAMPVLGQEQTGVETRLYRFQRLDWTDAQQLANSVCEDVWRSMRGADSAEEVRCEVAALGQQNALAVTTDLATHRRIGALLADLDRVPQSRSFHIVVLSASRAGETAPDLPDGAREALADIQEFLPYRAYSVLGSGWIRSSESGETTLPGAIEFSARINFRSAVDPAAPIVIERFNLFRKDPDNVLVSGEVQEGRMQGVLSTTFSMNPGETVVVGTSKLDGDDTAIVVLLTAVAS